VLLKLFQIDRSYSAYKVLFEIVEIVEIVITALIVWYALKSKQKASIDRLISALKTIEVDILNRLLYQSWKCKEASKYQMF